MYTYRTCNGEMRRISIYYWYVCIIIYIYICIYAQPLNSLFPIAKPQVESSGQAPMAPFHPAWRCTWKDNWAVLVMAILHGIDPNSYSSGTKSTKQTSRSCSSSRKKMKNMPFTKPQSQRGWSVNSKEVARCQHSDEVLQRCLNKSKMNGKSWSTCFLTMLNQV